MPSCDCGATVIEAVTPSGRTVRLDPDALYLPDDQPWPPGLYGIKYRGTTTRAVPAISAVDRAESGESGPFYRRHNHRESA